MTLRQLFWYFFEQWDLVPWFASDLFKHDRNVYIDFSLTHAKLRTACSLFAKTQKVRLLDQRIYPGANYLSTLGSAASKCELLIDTATDVENFKGGAAPAKKEAPAGPTIDRTGGGVIPAGTVTASPQAKKMAKKLKVDITKVMGTGNFGRVTEDDVMKAAGKAPAKAAAPMAAPTREIPELPDGPVKLTGMQSAVAGNMMKTMETMQAAMVRKLRLCRQQALLVVCAA